MFGHLIKGLDLTLGTGSSVAYLVGASVFGMLAGVLPGLGGPVVLSITLALIFHISLTGVLCIFLAIHAASFFTSSITAILLNTPQHAESFAVTFDGYPMAQRGEAGRALGISAASTCLGGFVGCAVLIGFIQIINFLPNLFHPPEYVALITIALLLVATLGTDAASKAVMSVGLGLLIATVGQNQDTGAFRFTFGAVGLLEGVGLVSLALGTFAIPQMVLLFGVSDRVARQDLTGREVGKVAPASLGDHFARQVVGGILETFRHWFLCLTSGLIGVATGIIPGIGGFAANFMSYGVAQQTSRKRALFGTGLSEGIIAPEGSSLAKEAGGMVPLLGLGIPGGVAGALFLEALSIKGLQPGFGFTQSNPDVAYEIVWIIAFGGLIGTLIGVLLAPLLARVTRIPGPCLVPIIFSVSIVGAFVVGPSFFLVMELPAFALLGFVFRRLRYAVGVLVVALVLGPTYENNIYLTHQVFQGWSFLEQPFADVLAVVAVLILVIKIRQQRGETIAERNKILEVPEGERTAEYQEYLAAKRPYPVLALIMSCSMLGIGAWASLYAVLNYSYINAIMPTFGGLLAAVGALCRIPGDVHALLARRTAIPRPQYKAASIAATSLLEASVAGSSGSGPMPSGSADLADREGDLADYGVSRSELAEPQQLAAADVTAPLGGLRHDRFPEIGIGKWGRNGQFTREVAAFAWFGALIGGAWLLGYYVAMPIFGLTYSVFGTKRTFHSLRARIMFGVFAGAFGWSQTFLIFRLLHISFMPAIHLP